ncbi:MAG: hypothetical protein IPP07_14750 [Holophagales bacterium]|nr:hypothetical protein [Holophagales bacterium]
MAPFQRLELCVAQGLDPDREPVHPEVDERREATVVQVVGVRLDGHLGPGRHPERVAEGGEDQGEIRGLCVGRCAAAEIDRVEGPVDLPARARISRTTASK